MNGYSISIPPKTVGYYRIGIGVQNFQIAFTSKPCLFHRTMMRICLGWVWEDL